MSVAPSADIQTRYRPAGMAREPPPPQLADAKSPQVPTFPPDHASKLDKNAVHLDGWFWRGGELNELCTQDEQIRIQENKWRLAFGKAPEVPVDIKCQDAIAAVKFASQPLYDSLHFPMPDPDASDDTHIPMVESQAEFEENWDAFTLGLHTAWAGLPLFAAGGAVLAALHRWPAIHIPPEVSAAYGHNNSASTNLIKMFVTEFGNYQTLRVSPFKFERPYKTSDVISNPAVVNTVFTKETVKRRASKKLTKPAPNLLPPDATKLTEAQKRRLGLMAYMHAVAWVQVDTAARDADLSSVLQARDRGVLIRPCRCPEVDEPPPAGKSKTPEHESLGLESDTVLRYMAPLYQDTMQHTAEVRCPKCDITNSLCDIQFVDRPSPALLKYLPPEVAQICASYTGLEACEVLSYAQPRARTLRSFRRSDVDLFLVTRDPDVAFMTLISMHTRLKQIAGEVVTVRSPNAITFVMPKPYRKVQVILRLYHSPAQVLLGFDLDCCAVGYGAAMVAAVVAAKPAVVAAKPAAAAKSAVAAKPANVSPTAVITSERGARALQTRCNLIDESRQSTTYEARLMKYMRRGFAAGSCDLTEDAMAELNVRAANYYFANQGLKKWRNYMIAALRTNQRAVGAARLVLMLHVVVHNLLGNPWAKPPTTRNAVRRTQQKSDRGSGPTTRRGHGALARMLGSHGNVCDYDGIDGDSNAPAPAASEFPRPITKFFNGKLTDAKDEQKKADNPLNVIPVLYTPHIITFQTQAPHVQGREMFTGSFNPIASNWLNPDLRSLADKHETELVAAMKKWRKHPPPEYGGSYSSCDSDDDRPTRAAVAAAGSEDDDG